MGMLAPTDLVAKITFLGINRDASDLTTESCTTVELDYAGVIGDSHAGLTRASCTRVRNQYPKGTEIRNTRQLSALSNEEMAEIQQFMQIDELKPEWVGANLVLEGLPQFSQLPPSSRLIAANGTSLVVDMENAPCRFPAEIISHYEPELGKLFPKAAVGRRGVTLWVERPGTLATGDSLTLHVPPVCDWRLPG